MSINDQIVQINVFAIHVSLKIQFNKMAILNGIYRQIKKKFIFLSEKKIEIIA